MTVREWRIQKKAFVFPPRTKDRLERREDARVPDQAVERGRADERLAVAVLRVAALRPGAPHVPLLAPVVVVERRVVADLLGRQHVVQDGVAARCAVRGSAAAGAVAGWLAGGRGPAREQTDDRAAANAGVL